MRKRSRVLVPEKVGEAGLAALRREVEVDFRPGMTAAELLEAVGRCDALIVRSGTRVTAEVIARGRRLRVVGRAGVGVDNVDLEAATAAGVVVVNAPDGNTVSAAEHTFALMLAAVRHVVEAQVSLRKGEWARSRFMGRELRGKTLAVVGLGRIGREVAARAQAFGMRVVGHDPFVPPDRLATLGVRVMDLEEALAVADVVSLHVPLTPATDGLLNAARIATMKPGAVLVNCARGGLIDERALLDALKEGRLGGAALDVFSREPATGDPVLAELFALPTVVATPHLGASTREAQDASAVEVAEQVLAVLRGGAVSAVNLPPLAPGEWEAAGRLAPLAEILGRVYAQAIGGPIADVGFAFEGEGGERLVDVLALASLVGLLAETAGQPLNLVNARQEAERRGIRLRTGVARRRAPLAVTEMAVSVRQGGKRNATEHTVGGYVDPAGGFHLSDLEGFPLDLAPAAHMLLTRHKDVPGMVGRVGSALGEAGVNIAGMQVGRARKGGPAVMVVTLDAAAPPSVVEALRKLAGIEDARAVTLPAALVRRAGGGLAAGSGR